MGAFRLSGDIDVATAPAMLEELVRYAATDTSNHRTLVIDCSSLTFIDSTGLSALEAIRKKTGRTVVLRSVPEQCRRVLEISGLDQLFVLVD